jgi:hypothetical protein
MIMTHEESLDFLEPYKIGEEAILLFSRERVCAREQSAMQDPQLAASSVARGSVNASLLSFHPVYALPQC